MDILENLSRQWILTEINHKVSKTASNQFWSISNDMFHALYVAKGDVGRKIPKFQQIRNKLTVENLPPIKMEIGYMSKIDGQITIVEDVSSTPVSAFPPSTHRRLFEIASVEVSQDRLGTTIFFPFFYFRY